MIISDLDYVEPIAKESSTMGGAGVVVGTYGIAYGEFTRTNTRTRTFARSLPHGGSIAIGQGHVQALALTPPSP